MKVLIILAIIVVATDAHMAERYIANSADPEKPGYCLHKELNASIKEGDTEQLNMNECVAYKCLPNGLISIKDCPYYPDLPHCTIFKTDLSKPFPDCCAHAKCY